MLEFRPVTLQKNTKKYGTIHVHSPPQKYNFQKWCFSFGEECNEVDDEVEENLN